MAGFCQCQPGSLANLSPRDTGQQMPNAAASPHVSGEPDTPGVSMPVPPGFGSEELAVGAALWPGSPELPAAAASPWQVLGAPGGSIEFGVYKWPCTVWGSLFPAFPLNVLLGSQPGTS